MTVERDIEDAFVDYVNERGGECLKLVDQNGNGFPDRTVLLPLGSRGRPFAIEFKRPGGQVRASQLQYIRRLWMCGLRVYVVDDLEVAITLFEDECND